MTRKQALNLIAAAVAANDMRTATRVYIENRISMAAFREACRAGQTLKNICEERSDYDR